MFRRALACDDSPIMRQTASFTLCQTGFDVLEATDGHEALTQAEGQQLAPIIPDPDMPPMDGLPFIREVRSSGAGKYVPTLMLTSENRTEKKPETRPAGVGGWLVKPFDPARLLHLASLVLPEALTS